MIAQDDVEPMVTPEEAIAIFFHQPGKPVSEEELLRLSAAERSELAFSAAAALHLELADE